MLGLDHLDVGHTLVINKKLCRSVPIVATENVEELSPGPLAQYQAAMLQTELKCRTKLTETGELSSCRVNNFSTRRTGLDKYSHREKFTVWSITIWALYGGTMHERKFTGSCCWAIAVSCETAIKSNYSSYHTLQKCQVEGAHLVLNG
uniref:Uncharacterized protein n=1 Tax=Timema monikensis TaxID=170555 RepID=A0A7R9E954_9NEOP|nr:unnamed protein product [Timema monikensis]